MVEGVDFSRNAACTISDMVRTPAEHVRSSRHHRHFAVRGQRVTAISIRVHFGQYGLSES